MNPRQFVLIEPNNKYTFYLNKAKVITVNTPESLDKQWLEYYRKDHKALLKDTQPPESA
jgi:hypothetical protein